MKYRISTQPPQKSKAIGTMEPKYKAIYYQLTYNEPGDLTGILYGFTHEEAQQRAQLYCDGLNGQPISQPGTSKTYMTAHDLLHESSPYNATGAPIIFYEAVPMDNKPHDADSIIKSACDILRVSAKFHQSIGATGHAEICTTQADQLEKLLPNPEGNPTSD